MHYDLQGHIVPCKLRPAAFVFLVTQLCMLTLGDIWVVLSGALGNPAGHELQRF